MNSVGDSDEDSLSSEESHFDDDCLYNNRSEELSDAYYYQRDEINENEPIRLGAFSMQTSRDIVLHEGREDQLFLKTARDEFKKVFENVATFLGDQQGRHYHIIEMFGLFFDQNMLRSFYKWVNDYNDANLQPITVVEFYAFLRIDLLLQFHKTSQEQLFHNYHKEKRYNVGEYMSQPTYSSIMRALKRKCKYLTRVGRWNSPICRNEEVIMIFEEFGRTCSKTAFISGTTMISLDDDLWRMRSREVMSEGVTQINNPKKGMGVKSLELYMYVLFRMILFTFDMKAH